MATVAASQASRRAVSGDTWMPPASSSTVCLRADGALGVEVAGPFAGQRADVCRARRLPPSSEEVPAGNVRFFGQGVSVHMHHHLIPVARRAPSSALARAHSAPPQSHPPAAARNSGSAPPLPPPIPVRPSRWRPTLT